MIGRMKLVPEHSPFGAEIAKLPDIDQILAELFQTGGFLFNFALEYLCH
jgi:hypothetical protein